MVTELLTDAQLEIYEIIKDEKRITQNKLAEKVDYSRSTISNTIKKLETLDRIEKRDIEGKKTKQIIYTKPAKDLDFSLLMAGKMLPPFMQTDNTDFDAKGDRFTNWLLYLKQDYEIENYNDK